MPLLTGDLDFAKYLHLTARTGHFKKQVNKTRTIRTRNKAHIFSSQKLFYKTVLKTETFWRDQKGFLSPNKRKLKLNLTAAV